MSGLGRTCHGRKAFKRKHQGSSVSSEDTDPRDPDMNHTAEQTNQSDHSQENAYACVWNCNSGSNGQDVSSKEHEESANDPGALVSSNGKWGEPSNCSASGLLDAGATMNRENASCYENKNSTNPNPSTRCSCEKDVKPSMGSANKKDNDSYVQMWNCHGGRKSPVEYSDAEADRLGDSTTDLKGVEPGSLRIDHTGNQITNTNGGKLDSPRSPVNNGAWCPNCGSLRITAPTKQNNVVQIGALSGDQSEPITGDAVLDHTKPKSLTLPCCSQENQPKEMNLDKGATFPLCNGACACHMANITDICNNISDNICVKLCERFAETGLQLKIPGDAAKPTKTDNVNPQSGACSCQEGVQAEPMPEEDILGDKSLLKLASNIGNEWFSIGIYLDFKRPFLENIQTKHRGDIPRVVFDMLDEFRKREPLDNTQKLDKLCDALKQSGRYDLAEMLNPQVHIYSNNPTTPEFKKHMALMKPARNHYAYKFEHPKPPPARPPQTP